MSVREGVKSACIPCGLGHVSTSSVLLNEAIRFKKDGLSSPQVLDDIAQAIGEFNALERIDLTPAKIAVLPDWEKEMAESTLEKSRELRHRLETVEDMAGLQQIAAETEDFFKHLNREWFSKRVGNSSSCPISTEEAEIEDIPEAETVIDEPKTKLSDYGRRTSEARRQLLEEIHNARTRE